MQKVKEFNRGIQAHRDLYETMYGRVLLEGCQNQVLIRDPATGNPKRVRMFASNNYLGLTTHPSVKEAACRAVQRYGVGSGGVPLLSGTLDIQRQLEAVLPPSSLRKRQWYSLPGMSPTSEPSRDSCVAKT
jgi:glycine C-acetyltransferase